MNKTFALALAGAAVLASPAMAQQVETRTTGVAYTDLDLGSEEGRKELDRRIENAASEACNMGQSTVGTRVRSREARDCYREAKRQLDRHFAQVIQDGQNQLGG